MNPEIDRILDKIEALPPAPFVLTRLIRMAEEPDVGQSELVRVIEADVGVTANLLHVCNTPHYAGSHRVSTVQEAVLRLGTRTLLQLVLAQESRSLLHGAMPGYGLGTGDLWRHSMGVAMACRILAIRAGHARPSLVYTGGLLHDLGKVVLDCFLQPYSREVLGRLRAGQDYDEAEAEVLGIGHAELGGRIAERWGFPESLARMIRYHHAPDQAPAERELSSLVHLGDALTHWLGIGLGRPGLAARLDPDAVEFAGLGSHDLDQALLILVEAIEQTETFLAA